MGCLLMLMIVIASRKGGPRIEVERWGNGVPVVHNYGHGGAGYQSSW
jgi:D-amino-acid oxidase